MKDTNQNNKNEKANGRKLSWLIGESPVSWLILTGKTPVFQASWQTALQREVNLLATSSDEVTWGTRCVPGQGAQFTSSHCHGWSHVVIGDAGQRWRKSPTSPSCRQMTFYYKNSLSNEEEEWGKGESKGPTGYFHLDYQLCNQQLC